LRSERRTTPPKTLNDCNWLFIGMTPHYGAYEICRRIGALAGLEPARCCHHLILSQVAEVSWAFP
jgi:hypothetical protein